MQYARAIDMTASPIKDTDVVRFTASDGTPQSASLVVAVGPNGEPTGAVKITPRAVEIINGRTIAGSKSIIYADWNRTGLTIRNDSDTQMYFNLDADADADHGYPLDARRGYSFEALGMLPMNEVFIWCATADQKYVVLVATKTTEEEADA